MGTGAFGSSVRQIRLSQGIGLRELAGKLAISPTYLSKIERDECPPPPEKTIRRIADILDADFDQLMALARRVPAELESILQERPKQLANFLRTARSLPNSALEKLIRQAETIKEKAKRRNSRG